MARASASAPEGGAQPAAALGGWLEECRAWVERHLGLWVPARATAPARLHAAMQHALMAGGKRLRPALVRGVARALGGADDDAAAPAVALELVHTYSLVHDDLPCMDDDALRRGLPTVHVAFDEATAVLAGDGLLTLAFEVLGERAGARAGALGLVLARAAGSRGMVGGQAIDLALEQAGGAGDLARVEELHALKTAALFSAACEMGAIAAGAEARRAEVADFGLLLGRLFQAVDDVLDVVGDAATLGKTPGKDRANERTTLVSVLGLEGARAHARRLGERAAERARGLGWGPGEPVHDLVGHLLERRA